MEPDAIHTTQMYPGCLSGKPKNEHCGHRTHAIYFMSSMRPYIIDLKNLHDRYSPVSHVVGNLYPAHCAIPSIYEADLMVQRDGGAAGC